ASRSSSGRTTIFQAFENAVWPVRPMSQASTRVTRVPGGPWRLALSAASRPPAPAPTTSTSVSIRTPSIIALPWPRPILHRRVHVHDLLRTENFATETGDAMLAEFDVGDELELPQVFDFVLYRRGFHVDHVGGTDKVANAAARALLDVNCFDHKWVV